jgi:hypothetical protein
MKLKTAALVASLAFVLGLQGADASGPLGVYGIVEKVVMEPSEQTPERIQVWGAFAYVDGGLDRALNVSSAKRGFLYFKLPPSAPASEVALVKREWSDLKAVAGTGQAIGFGSWSYIGAFGSLQPETRSSKPPYVLERGPSGNTQTDLRVRPATETPSSPAIYQTNVGVIKLSEQGSHAATVRKLKDTLKP